MLLGLVMVVIFIIPVSAAVFRVPDDSPSIQKALSTAHAGDTVLVAPGIYYESLTMQPGVHLHGQPGAILDGSQTFSPVVRALPGIDHTAILSVIRRGQQAGLFLNQATPTIRNNVIIDNLGPGVSVPRHHHASSITLSMLVVVSSVSTPDSASHHV